MSTNKRAYQAAVKEIRSLFGDEADAYLHTVEHYVGELRRDKSTAESKVATLERTIALVQQGQDESSRVQAKLQDDREALQSQLQSALGQLRREREEADTLRERMKQQANVCKFAFGKLLDGGEFIIAPAGWCDDWSFRLCVVIENVLPRIVTGLTVTIAEEQCAPRSDAMAAEITKKMTKANLGISRLRYEEILRSTCVPVKSALNRDQFLGAEQEATYDQETQLIAFGECF